MLFFLYVLQAENRIIQKFPERIVNLNELLKKPEFRISELDLKADLGVPTLMKAENYANK